MRKKILVILVTIVMMFGAVFGCSPSYPELNVQEKPDNKYAVTSNGGFVVQKGDFIYFVNGYKSIVDEDGKNNIWGEVEKGGIYYAKLTQGTDKEVNDYYGKYITYDNSNNEFNDEFSGFETQELTYKDENNQEQTKNQIKVSPVVSKLVTNGGYIDGGIYIIDDYIYYATPTTKKDKKGDVQYELVDFFRTRIDGKGTQYLYTSKSTSQKPVYGYYKYNNDVFAVFYEASESKIYSVEITDNQKVKKAKVLADKVTSAILPQKEVYYDGISQDMPEDFIYYTREIDIEIDSSNEGNIVERVRPDGSDSEQIKSGVDVTLDKVSKGHLFYFVDRFENTSNRYYFAQDYNNDDQNSQPVVIFNEPMDSFPTDVFGIVYSYNDLLAMAVKGNSTVLYQAGLNTGEKQYNDKVKVLYVDYNDAYFVIDNTTQESPNLTFADLYKMNYFNGQNEKLTEVSIKVDFLNIDVAAGYVFYISTVNEIAQTITKDDQTVTVLASSENYVRLQNMKSATKTEWDMGWLDKVDYPDLDK